MTGTDHPQRKQPATHSLTIPASHLLVQHQVVNGCMTEEKIDTFVEDNLDAYSYLKVNGSNSVDAYNGQ
jgi:hypothetical protein